MMQPTATCINTAPQQEQQGSLSFVSVKKPYLFFLQLNENSAASAQHKQPTGAHS